MNIEKAKRITKRIILSDLFTKDGLALSVLLDGPHGIGKSQIVNKLAKDMKGDCFVVEGGSLKEGELPGLPMATKASDGSLEVQFVPYKDISKIQILEKYYKNKSEVTGIAGFWSDNDGEYILENNKKNYYFKSSEIDKISSGEKNRFKFGETLTGDQKLELLENGNIKPIILFIDEMNRADSQTMKEMMNIVLTRNINGYDLPWWVFVVSAINPFSQNTSYATNELDPAQLDRFFMLNVEPDYESWIDYGLKNSIAKEILNAVAINPDILIQREVSKNSSTTANTTKMSTSPRSIEMVSVIFDTIEKVNNSKFFTQEEKELMMEDFETIIRCKIGDSAGGMLIMNIKERNSLIKAEEILDGASDEVSESVRSRFNKQNPARQKITVNTFIEYLKDHINDILDNKTSKDSNKKVKAVKQLSQLSNFICDIMSPSLRLSFSNLAIETKVPTKTKSGVVKDKVLFFLISDYCGADILNELQSMKVNIKELLNNDN